MKTGGITFSTTYDTAPGIKGGVGKSAKRHLLYIDNTCKVIIIILYIPTAVELSACIRVGWCRWTILVVASFVC